MYALSMKPHIRRVIMIYLFSSLALSGGVWTGSGQTNTTPKGVVQEGNAADDSRLMNQMAVSSVREALAMLREGIDPERFQRIADRRTELLKHNNPRCRLLGLHLQSALCHSLVTAALSAKHKGSFDVTSEPWKTLVRTAALDSDLPYQMAFSLKSGIAGRLQTLGLSKAMLANRPLVSTLDDLVLKDENIRTNWTHWRTYIRGGTLLKYIPRDPSAMSNLVLARSMTSLQSTIHMGFYLQALSNVGTYSIENHRREIQRILPKDRVRADTGKEFDWFDVVRDADSMDCDDYEESKEGLIGLLSPFISPSPLPEDLRSDVCVDNNYYGFMLSDQ